MNLIRALIVSAFCVLQCLGLQAQENSTPTNQAPPKVGDRAPDFSLPSLDGSVVRLADHMKEGTTVVVVLRGFPGYQCPLCTRQVASLVQNSEAFRKKNASVILVYPGPGKQLVDKAKQFVEKTSLPKNITLVIDSEYKVVKQYGLRWEAANETAYPSTFVVDASGKILYAKISKSHGGRADTSEILKAIP